MSKVKLGRRGEGIFGNGLYIMGLSVSMGMMKVGATLPNCCWCQYELGLILMVGGYPHNQVN